MKVLIKDSKGERWVDGNKLFAHLYSNYIKQNAKDGKKPTPYKEKVENFFKSIDSELISLWEDSYTNVDVDAELKICKAWLLTNTDKPKTHLKRFINNWLSNQTKTSKMQPKKPQAKPNYNPYVEPTDVVDEAEVQNLFKSVKDSLR